jgi:hypothetical protein
MDELDFYNILIDLAAPVAAVHHRTLHGGDSDACHCVRYVIATADDAGYHVRGASLMDAITHMASIPGSATGIVMGLSTDATRAIAAVPYN